MVIRARMSQWIRLFQFKVKIICVLWNECTKFLEFCLHFGGRAFHFCVLWLASVFSIFVLIEKLYLGLYLGFLYSSAHSLCFVLPFQNRLEEPNEFTCFVRSGSWKVLYVDFFFHVFLQLFTFGQCLAWRWCCLLFF